MDGKLNLLISGAGGSSAIKIIKELKKDPLYNVTAIDADPYSVGLYINGNSFVVPLVNDPRFKDTIKKIISEKKIDLYIPLIDEEINVAYELQRELPNLKLLVPTLEFCRNMLNKWEMYKLFRANDLPVPDSYLFNDVDMVDFSSIKIVKPIVGRGSRGVQTIDSKQELDAYLTLSHYKKEELLIQEYVRGIEYTVSVIVNKMGEVLKVVPKRIIRKKGITQVAITEKNEIINSLCEDIQNKLKANGPFNVQLVLYNNKPYVFEINPRFSTSVVLTMEAGINEVDVLVKDSFDISYDINDFREGLIMSRYYEQFYIMGNNVK